MGENGFAAHSLQDTPTLCLDITILVILNSTGLLQISPRTSKFGFNFSHGQWKITKVEIDKSKWTTLW